MAKQKYENKMINSVLNYDPKNKPSDNCLDLQRKTKQYLFRIYPKTWEIFTAINKRNGLSNSAALSLLIYRYIKKNGENFD